MESLKYIRPSEASLLACAEPLSASFLAVVWLQVSFSMIEWLGAFCIILAIFVLSAIRRQS
jgi:drug/metabolite transporter (DMT)-like permease